MANLDRAPLILAGGGEAEDSRPLDELFAAWTGANGKMLYIPVAAMQEGLPRSFEASLTWIRAVFFPLYVKQIYMWTDLSKEDFHTLDDFRSIYIGGGNTYQFLHLVRSTGFDRVLVEFAARGGAVYGGSAGAIIMGRDIETCAHIDSNDIGLEDSRGLDLAWGHAIWCHYAPHDDERIAAYIDRTGIPVLALTERAGVQVYGDLITALGYEPIKRFTPGTQHSINVGQTWKP